MAYLISVGHSFHSLASAMGRDGLRSSYRAPIMFAIWEKCSPTRTDLHSKICRTILNDPDLLVGSLYPFYDFSISPCHSVTATSTSYTNLIKKESARLFELARVRRFSPNAYWSSERKIPR